MAVIRHEHFGDPFDRLMAMAARGADSPLAMPIDVYRSGDGNYHVEADLPGIGPGSVEVTVEHGILTIKAERASRYGEDGEVLFAERPQGTFTRQLTLGEGVDSDQLTASYEDGVLHLLLPASPRARARRIEVTHGGGTRTIHGGTAGQDAAPGD